MIGVMRIEVAPGITLTDADIDVTVARSGGPGGQHVNRTSSKVQLRFHLEACPQLAESVKARIRAQHAGRLTEDGDLLMGSELTRDQHRNLDDACEKLASLLRAALIPPKPRHKTKPTKGSKRRRLNDKRHRSDTKRGRGPIGDD